MVPANYPKLMGTRSYGAGTATGEGNLVYDDQGRGYRIVSPDEAERIRNSTGGYVHTLYPDGTIR